MSSLRNAIKRKTHKERSQPSARKKYGLLEKHKDYVLRAKDFHRKEAAIQNLKRKAEDRNPDEFYFAMEKARTKDGVHIGRASEDSKYTDKEIKLMKSQDVTYVRMKAQMDLKKAEKMKQSLHLLGEARQNKHTVFVDDSAEASSFQAAARFGMPGAEAQAEVAEDEWGRDAADDEGPGGEASGSGQGGGGPAELSKPEQRKQQRAEEKLQRLRAGVYKDLEARQARGERLLQMARDMELKNQTRGKGAKKKLTVKDANGKQKTFYKWKTERKK